MLHYVLSYPTNTKHLPNVGLMFDHRLRRCPNINTTLVECNGFVEIACMHNNILFQMLAFSVVHSKCGSSYLRNTWDYKTTWNDVIIAMGILPHLGILLHPTLLPIVAWHGDDECRQMHGCFFVRFDNISITYERVSFNYSIPVMLKRMTKLTVPTVG